MLGHGGVPWPFVRRSRFVKELERQGEAYRQNVRAAESEAYAWKVKYEDAKDEFVEMVKHLQGYYDAEHVYHAVRTHSADGVPQHFMKMGVARDVYTDSVTFGVRVSRMMLERTRDLKVVYQYVVEELVAAMLHEAMNPSDPWKGGT